MLLLLKGPGVAPAPVHLLGVYQETFDFGTLVSATIATLDWSVINVVGSVTILSYLSTSTDGITFTAPVAATSLYAASVRYVKARVEFTAANTKSAIKFVNFRCSLSVHQENDGGTISALSTDVSGTRVTFNKTFKATPTITLTPQSNVTVFAAYFNEDATGFNVFCWNSAGVRVSKTVTWAARGIV